MKYRMDEITESCLGKMLDAQKNTGEYQPYLANINVRWGSFDLENLSLMRFEAHESERYGIKDGDLIMCEGGEPGRCAIWRDEIPNMKIQKALHRIRANKDLVDVEYLYYWFLLSGRNDSLRRYFTETTIKHLPGETLKQLEIDLPDLQCQKAISKVLGVIDKKIALNNKVNDNLQQMAKTIYDYWFTQFDFPNECGNPYSSSNGQMVWNETAKQNLPLGWSCSKMENAIENVRTGLNPRDNFKLGGGSIKYITVKNLRSDGVLDFSGCDTIDEAAQQIVHRRSDVSVGDILFASIAPLGRCYLVQEAPQDWDINESVFSIRYNKETVTPEYLYMHLQSEAFVKESTACSTGSIFKGIRINSLLDSKIIVPPMEIIEEFSKEVRPLFAMQNRLNKETHALIQLRDWLLPMLMNGQATVSD